MKASDPTTLVVRLPRDDAAQLGILRTATAVELCYDKDWIWLRAANPSDSVRQLLQKLPSAEMFRQLPDRQLVRVDALVPRGYVPDGEWLDVREELQVELPAAALAGTVPAQASFTLCPDPEFHEPNVLVISARQWREYGSTAPRVRLERWSFALSVDGEVLVRGTPLPPLQGRQFVESNGIAVPAGQTWKPAVKAEVLAKMFEVAENDLLLWKSDERCERIRAGQFVRATRSAIRESTAANA